MHVSWSILSIRSPENHAAGMDSAVKILNFIRPLNDLYSLSNFVSLMGILPLLSTQIIDYGAVSFHGLGL